ncbi:DUF2384 domain-containing protein [Maribacter algarum]|uniref:DUF2384 domain-containing protein n=1 Tax=Maribacter algarum (ex Zhang et al. 2020) TaxID=2578118 RepID=A0A5S3PX00_9FLAO|nr:DUF2384 domain-containing protein [Maribacter algarum]
MEKIELIRKGLSYAAIESLNEQTKVPLNHFLNSLEITQNTYAKKKRTKAVLSQRKSEFVMELVELFDYGLRVFNYEEKKFQRWLQKPNITLNDLSPHSFFDTTAGISEVRKVLNRIENGNMA